MELQKPCQFYWHGLLHIAIIMGGVLVGVGLVAGLDGGWAQSGGWTAPGDQKGYPGPERLPPVEAEVIEYKGNFLGNEASVVLDDFGNIQFHGTVGGSSKGVPLDVQFGLGCNKNGVQFFAFDFSMAKSASLAVGNYEIAPGIKLVCVKVDSDPTEVAYECHLELTTAPGQTLAETTVIVKPWSIVVFSRDCANKVVKLIGDIGKNITQTGGYTAYDPVVQPPGSYFTIGNDNEQPPYFLGFAFPFGPRPKIIPRPILPYSDLPGEK